MDRGLKRRNGTPARFNSDNQELGKFFSGGRAKGTCGSYGGHGQRRRSTRLPSMA